GRIIGGLARSPDKRSLAYSIYGSNEVIIWNTEHMKIARTVNIAPLYCDLQPAYTPDGKLLVISAYTVPLRGEEGKHQLVFYDTMAYQIVSRLDVPRISAIAVSPDSRTLAIAYKKEERKTLWTDEQALVVLYDLATGEAVATASHPEVKQRRSD